MSIQRQSILFISGIDRSINENHLFELFNEFPITYIKIAKSHRTKEPFGYGFVGFKSIGKAEEALTKLNYTKLGKKTLRISWFSREPINPRTSTNNNIFVKKFDLNTTHREFHNYFAKFGNIISAKLEEDEEGEVIGYGFVLYDNEESAKLAITETNSTMWKGRRIYVGPFIKKRPKTETSFNTIYVKNIPKTFTEEDLRTIFAKYGEITSIFMKSVDDKQLQHYKDEKKILILNFNYAFITFKESRSAISAVNIQPYTKLEDDDFNNKIRSLINCFNPLENIEYKDYYRFACYLVENVENYHELVQDPRELKILLNNFLNETKEFDGQYLARGKGFLVCCQALKKKDRKKVVKLITEKIKKKLKEKYKFCNLFIKNIPDNLEESDLMTILSKYGKIRSFRLVLNEKSFSQFLHIKIPHNKRYAFVCYEDELCASKCKMELHNKVISSGINRLYVNFHQSKNERADFLKMVFLNQSKKFLTNNCSINDQITQAYNPRYNQPDLSPYQMNILKIGSKTRKLPHENFPAFYKGFVRVSNPSNDNIKDMYGERLYKKINSNLKFESYSRFFNKIIGIFLELDEDCLKRLIDDTVYFDMQVEETIKMLIEKESKN